MKKADELNKDESNKKDQAEVFKILDERLKEGVRGLKAYSVPRIECPVRLDGNESPFGMRRELAERVSSALSALNINRYPDPEALDLRSKISELYGIPSDSILLGNGSDELISLLLISFTGMSGAVLYPVPTFSMYGLMARALELMTLEVALDDNFDIDLEKTLESIERNAPDVIFFASPNNPTANCFSTGKIKEVLDFSTGIVVVDEAYHEFSSTNFLPLLDTHANLIVMRTMSKIGFAALRLGILFGRSEIVEQINKVRMPYNINSFSQKTAELALADYGTIRENAELIVREKGRVYDALCSIGGVEPFQSDANFILLRTEDANGVFAGLIEQGVLVRNLGAPGRLANCLRVTIGTPEDNDAFLSAIESVFSS